ncbi:MAG TPA: hypothetical protein DEQ30_03110 [Porphyromonadaceae bacterium]|nr:hypothetical protein [Porphyromonadaceae bacterium]
MLVYSQVPVTEKILKINFSRKSWIWLDITDNQPLTPLKKVKSGEKKGFFCVIKKIVSTLAKK